MMMDTFSIVSTTLHTPLCCRSPVGRGCAERSDAAARLGDARDLRRQLGRALREELVQLLHRDARGLAQYPDGRPGALGLILGPHESDDGPVPVGQEVDPLPSSG